MKAKNTDQQPHEETREERKYRILSAMKYSECTSEELDKGEDMAVFQQVILGYWKPLYLLDCRMKCAYEFMSESERLMTVTVDDIAWETLETLSEELKERARSLSAHYPTFIYRFERGVAQVSWQLNPDGRYFMDEDGYGMTSDREVTLYGFIDRAGRVVEKFRYGCSDDELAALRKQAEAVVAKR